jgi:hypothetical protein
MLKAIKTVSEYKTSIIVVSLLAYVLKPSLSAYALSPFIPIILASPICVFIIYAKKITFKTYLGTFFSLKAVLYSLLILATFLIPAYSYATAMVFFNVNPNLKLGFIPISALYYLASPLLIRVCTKEWGAFPTFKTFVMILLTILASTTFSIVVRSMNIENIIIIEILAFLSVFVSILSCCILAALIVPQGRKEGKAAL